MHLDHSRKAGISDHVAQADIVHPHLCLGNEHGFLRAQHCHRDLRHASQIRWAHAGILDLYQVRSVAPDERRRIAATLGRPGRTFTANPRAFDLRPQCEPAVEFHHHFGLPAKRARTGAVHVEIVFVAPNLDGELEIAGLPTGPTPPHPRAQCSILQEIFVRPAGE